MSNEYHFKKGWLLVALLGISLSAGAQQLVRGTVSDGTEPLPAVSVIVKGTASGTQTDENGAFSIRVNPEDVLQFSLLGFRSEEHTSELQSLMRTSYAHFCLQQKPANIHTKQITRL